MFFVGSFFFFFSFGIVMNMYQIIFFPAILSGVRGFSLFFSLIFYKIKWSELFFYYHFSQCFFFHALKITGSGQFSWQNLVVVPVGFLV
jgi:hypothetical protein